MLNPVFSRTSRQGGSSLIEVLVAVIVLSIGMRMLSVILSA